MLKGVAGHAEKGKSSRLLARLKANLRQTSEPKLRARLLAAIEQLTKENGAGKS
jgi:hypothetical protein